MKAISNDFKENNDNIIAELNILFDIDNTFYYKPKTKEELINYIKAKIKIYGNTCNLNNIDVSEITDMSNLFEDSKFNGDISKWDVSNVTNMQNMFAWSKFNQDIGKWNVSNVENMSGMFKQSSFNQNISNWDCSHVYYAYRTFNNCPINYNHNKKPKNI